MEQRCEICEQKIESEEEQYSCEKCGKEICWECIGINMFLCNECEEDNRLTDVLFDLEEEVIEYQDE